MQHYFYLGIDLGLLALITVLSFWCSNERSSLKIRLRAVALMLLLFIPWNIYFTHVGYWTFEKNLLTGPKLWSLPIEEWGFMILIPYLSMLIYELVGRFSMNKALERSARAIAMGLAGILLILGVLCTGKLYTALTFLLCAPLLLYHGLKGTAWLGHFFLSFPISLVAFLLVDSLRSGSLVPMPVVYYDNVENMALRLGAIPVENCIYFLLMLLIVTQFYEGSARPSTAGN